MTMKILYKITHSALFENNEWQNCKITVSKRKKKLNILIQQVQAPHWPLIGFQLSKGQLRKNAKKQF